jgi:hypothetical protein
MAALRGRHELDIRAEVIGCAARIQPPASLTSIRGAILSVCDCYFIVIQVDLAAGWRSQRRVEGACSCDGLDSGEEVRQSSERLTR